MGPWEGGRAQQPQAGHRTQSRAHGSSGDPYSPGLEGWHCTLQGTSRDRLSHIILKQAPLLQNWLPEVGPFPGQSCVLRAVRSWGSLAPGEQTPASRGPPFLTSSQTGLGRMQSRQGQDQEVEAIEMELDTTGL